MSDAKLPLNQGQQSIADKFFRFLLSDKSEMVIAGAGGTGKTFLMGHLIDEILPRYHDICKMMNLEMKYDEVVMTATTNMAAQVLGLATNRPATTIHSFMNLTIRNNFKTGKQELQRSGSWTVHTNKIIFVDEYSMVDWDLLTYIREGTRNCKIIWVGDSNQLLSVGSALTETGKSVVERGLPVYYLTEPMRNPDQPALQDICQVLRDSVEAQALNPSASFPDIQIVPGVIDYFDDSQMEQELLTRFAVHNPDSRILAYENSRVVLYNEFIRQVRGEAHNSYTAGVWLVCASAYKHREGFLAVEQRVMITTLAKNTMKVELEPGVEMEVRYADLIDKFGCEYPSVPLPEDREHYYELVKYYGRVKNWKIYFHLKESFPDLRPLDACTVYKAQGSTYDTVFIDVGNLSKQHQPKTFSRMMYVGASRARQRIIFYGDLAPKYGRIVL